MPRNRHLNWTYADANTFLNGKDSKNYPGLTATVVRRDSDRWISVYYHDTPVVGFKSNGTIVLYTDGYYTPTTKARINTFQSHVLVYQEKNVWYVRNEETGEVSKFEEGMYV